jgi:DNA polymerase-1
VLEHVDDISGAKRKQNLTESPTTRACSKQLATMVRDVPVELDLSAELTREPDRSRLRAIFRDFELRDPLRRLEEALDAAASAAIPRPEAESAAHRRGAPRQAGRPAAPDRGRAGDRRDRAGGRPRVSCCRAPTAWRFGAYAGGPTRSAGEVGRPAELVAGGGRPPGDRARREGARRGPREPRLGHEVAAYLLDPGAPRLPARRALRGARHGRRRRRSGGRARRARARARGRQREQVRERGSEDLLREIELPLVHVLRESEKAGIKLDTARLEQAGLGMRAARPSSSARSGSWPARSS